MVKNYNKLVVTKCCAAGDWPDESSSNVPGWVWIVSALGIGLLYFVIVVLVICVRDYREERQRKKESNLGVTDVNSYGVRVSTSVVTCIIRQSTDLQNCFALIV